MQKRLAIAAPVALAAALVALVAYQRLAGRAGASTSAASAAPAASAARADRADGLVPRAHYRLAYRQAVALAGRAPIEVTVEGEWITTPRRDGRVEVQLAPARLEGPAGALPAAGAVAAPVQLVAADGVLAAIGFPAAMPELGRALMTALATTLQRADRAGASFSAVEEDVLGRYGAAYRRAGDVVTRTRDAYQAVRGATGLSPGGARDVTPREQTRFTLDVDGLAAADVALDLRIAIGEGAPATSVGLRASLRRTAIEWVQPPSGPALPAEPIADHADHAAARRSADQSVIAGASLAQLLGELAQAARLDAARAGTGQARSHALARLAAYIRVNPAAAAAVAEALRAGAADRGQAQLLAGALASARVPEGTDALAGLATAELPAPAQTDVVNALTLSEPVTAASLDALDRSLDGADARQAALALGSHVRRADAELAAQSQDAVAELLARYAAAPDAAERAVIVQALGNSGSPAALPLLGSLIRGGDRDLARTAVFSLRFIAGAEVDALLESALADAELAFPAVRAIGFRAPAAWRDRLVDAQDQYAQRNDILAAIQAIQRRWG